jgi:hypothetical protein
VRADFKLKSEDPVASADPLAEETAEGDEEDLLRIEPVDDMFDPSRSTMMALNASRRRAVGPVGRVSLPSRKEPRREAEVLVASAEYPDNSWLRRFSILWKAEALEVFPN